MGQGGFRLVRERGLVGREREEETLVKRGVGQPSTKDEKGGFRAKSWSRFRGGAQYLSKIFRGAEPRWTGRGLAIHR